MAIRNIREQGDSVLNKTCKEITAMTPRLRDLIEDMLDTMYEANGVGLAAPQVGILKQMVFTHLLLLVGVPMVLGLMDKFLHQMGQQFIGQMLVVVQLQ